MTKAADASKKDDALLGLPAGFQMTDTDADLFGFMVQTLLKDPASILPLFQHVATGTPGNANSKGFIRIGTICIAYGWVGATIAESTAVTYGVTFTAKPIVFAVPTNAAPLGSHVARPSTPDADEDEFTLVSSVGATAAWLAIGIFEEA